MNKAELITSVQQRAGLTRADAAKAVDALLDTVTESLVNGDDVRLAGFGNFAVMTRQSRKGRNPRTGQTLQIAASKTVSFKPGQPVKAALNV